MSQGAKKDQVDAELPPADHTDASPGTAARSSSSDKQSLTIENYVFKYPRRGRAVIVNNREFDYQRTRQMERTGTDVDAAALESLFLRLGFEVERHDNMTTLDMSMMFRKLGAEDHSDADCFVCAILSHGEDGLVYGTNGKLKLEKIFENFRGDLCPTLAEKPKLFFIQACRGRRYDWGVEVADADVPDADITDGPSVRKIPVEADFLMAYSVCPGYFSWRNNVDGSWFVQALVEVFGEHGDTMELMDILKLVSRRVAYDFKSCTDDDFTTDMKQMPCLVSTLTRNIYFKPKY